MALEAPKLTGDYAAQAANVNEKFDFAATLSNNPQAQAGANAMKDNNNQIFGVAQKFGINLKDGWQENEAAKVSNYIAESGLGKQMQPGHQIFTDNLQNATTSDANLNVNGESKQFVTDILDPHMGTYGVDGKGNNINQNGDTDQSFKNEAGYMNLLTNMSVDDIAKQLAPEDNTGGGGGEAGGAEEATGGAGEAQKAADDKAAEAAKGDKAAEAAKGDKAEEAAKGEEAAGAAEEAAAAEEEAKNAENTQKIMDQFDKNGDGKLNADEIKDLMSKFDKNGDGKLDADELKAMAEELGIDPAELTKMLDQDGSGDVSTDELSQLEGEAKDLANSDATETGADSTTADALGSDTIGATTDVTESTDETTSEADLLASSSSLTDFMNTDYQMAA